VPILVELLNDQDEEIRKASARALGQIGPAAESAVEPLLNMIQ
jgi:HEAT repeat protein